MEQSTEQKNIESYTEESLELHKCRAQNRRDYTEELLEAIQAQSTITEMSRCTRAWNVRQKGLIA
ncbi:hypothetical protein I7I48_10304 [Histoplasma ohiense]|nr:hypothetical protein I7I48_10304 [Histoplasma ohiense (nom. inval.)]